MVWGLLHGPQRGKFEMTFELPAQCAEAVASCAADIGLIPCIELERQDLGVVPGLGISSNGPVRSILLISKVPAREIRVLAADSSSRTSVVLSRIVLERRFGVTPEIITHAPDLEPMLAVADAALIIGDPALRLDPGTLPYHVYDLGAEWTGMTGLPMVFAVWAGEKSCITPEVSRVFRDSYCYGRKHLEDILREDAAPRGFPLELARRYLSRHIVYELTPAAYEGMALFRRLARECGAVHGTVLGTV
ncbi:MAG: menaquinone biosynthesis protein [Acidobacteriota bacterium]|nr:menaquinone biosynthesis protein [Acidobacteriota bacterium]